MAQYGLDPRAHDVAFQALKTEVLRHLPNPIPPFFDDKCLGRFLRACKLDVSKAKDMILTSMGWRETFHVDGILDRPPPSDVFVKAVPHGFLGHAKDGSPIFIVRLGFADMHLLESIPKDQIDHWIIWTLEYREKLIRDAGNEQWYVIVDMSGPSKRVSSSDLTKSFRAIREANYPEGLCKLFMVNAGIFWRAFKFLLTNDGPTKVYILGNNYESELYNWIDRDQLPPFLKGTRQNIPSWCREMPTPPWWLTTYRCFCFRTPRICMSDTVAMVRSWLLHQLSSAYLYIGWVVVVWLPVPVIPWAVCRDSIFFTIVKM